MTRFSLLATGGSVISWCLPRWHWWSDMPWNLVVDSIRQAATLGSLLAGMLGLTSRSLAGRHGG
jgi:hypothetical protein